MLSLGPRAPRRRTATSSSEATTPSAWTTGRVMINRLAVSLPRNSRHHSECPDRVNVCRQDVAVSPGQGHHGARLLLPNAGHDSRVSSARCARPAGRARVLPPVGRTRCCSCARIGTSEGRWAPSDIPPPKKKDGVRDYVCARYRMSAVELDNSEPLSVIDVRRSSSAPRFRVAFLTLTTGTALCEGCPRGGDPRSNEGYRIEVYDGECNARRDAAVRRSFSANAASSRPLGVSLCLGNAGKKPSQMTPCLTPAGRQILASTNVEGSAATKMRSV